MARATRAEWAKRVERWSDSGLTAKEFAAELDVSPHSLTFWKWKLRREQCAQDEARMLKPPKLGSQTAEPKFLQLVATHTEAQPLAAVLEVVIRGDIIVRVPRDFDDQMLTRVIRALGAR